MSRAVHHEIGAEATVNIEELKSPQERIARVREIVGGFGAELARQLEARLLRRASSAPR